MDAIFRILAQIEAVDRATNPLNRIAGAFSRLGHFATSAIGVMVGGMGLKGLFDWTVTAAGNIQMMQMGMAAMLSGTVELERGIHQGLGASANLGKSLSDFNLSAGAGLRSTAGAANETAKALKGVGDATKGAGQQSATLAQLGVGGEQAKAAALGMKAADYQQAKFNLMKSDAEQITNMLQRASIVGIGTFEDYMMTANVTVGALKEVLDLTTAIGQAKFVDTVNLTQISARTLLPAHGPQQAAQMAARELVKAIQGNVQSDMPYLQALLAGIPNKMFNNLSAKER